jgi:hypothetical protein
MDMEWIVLTLLLLLGGVVVFKLAAHSPQCPLCRIPAEPMSAIRGDHRFPVVETIFWCPRCARVISRRFISPHMD